MLKSNERAWLKAQRPALEGALRVLLPGIVVCCLMIGFTVN